MPGRLKGKVAIITGSTSGIGLGLAQSLAAEGADVVLNGFGDPAEIKRLRKGMMATHGTRVTYSDADLAQPAAVSAMVEQATVELGAVDILVNNAGIQHTAPVQEFPPKIVRQCSLPLTSTRPVDLVVTELAVIAFPGGCATLLETAPGVSVKDVLAKPRPTSAFQTVSQV
jgi:NAD(P)-dependent dehydrogenase (short-subunit alcohol dehydrogenase family)